MNKLLIFFLIIFSLKSVAQVGIKEINSAPNSKAMLDVESANKGILIPRMNTATRNAITSPTNGLMIYNNQTKKFNFFDGIIWKESLYSNQWSKIGANISYTAGFIGINTTAPARDLVINSTGAPDILFQQGASTGTTSLDGFMLGTNFAIDGEIWNFENAGIKFGTNNSEKMRISASGNVGINNTNPNEKLEVGGNIKALGNIQLSSGEINRTATGTANLIPIAYGNTSASGGMSGGSGNVTSVKLSTGVYELTIAGEVIDSYENYFFKLVPQSANPLIANVNVEDSKLKVKIYNAGGLSQDGNFSFVVFKL